jgi:hypothetical protein
VSQNNSGFLGTAAFIDDRVARGARCLYFFFTDVYEIVLEEVEVRRAEMAGVCSERLPIAAPCGKRGSNNFMPTIESISCLPPVSRTCRVTDGAE